MLVAVAAALAFAAVTSIAAVRIIDADREEERALPSLETISMVGSGGAQVGRVTVTSGTPAAVAVSVDYAVPDGEYSLVVRHLDTDQRVIGSITITDGRGEWSGTTAIPRSDATIALVSATGSTVCEASLAS